MAEPKSIVGLTRQVAELEEKLEEARVAHRRDLIDLHRQLDAERAENHRYQRRAQRLEWRLDAIRSYSEGKFDPS